ncbi:hypothetical protein [Spirillospora sp. NPDC029432]|uniref:hypothetical protein n=1 Tax=Spirillospora sp. NPDC029432 TaxID=3154599 RepID=UPI003455A6E6
MIILSGVLVIVAIALLVAGIVAGNGESAQVLGLDALVVIYISIGVSVVSALCLAIGVFLRRKELFGTGAAVAPARKSARKDKAKSKGKKPAAAPVPAAGRGKPAAPVGPTAGPADDDTEIPPPPADVPDHAVVFVVRGRKRYHLDTCRQLAGRDKEELTYAEAREEGFSSCTACMPDTALAARAAVSVPAGVPAGGKAAGSGPAEGTAGGKGESGGPGPVGLSKSPPPAGATTPLPAEALRSEAAKSEAAKSEPAKSEFAGREPAASGPAAGDAAAATTEIPVTEPPSSAPVPGAGDPQAHPEADRPEKAAGSVPAPAPAADPVPSAWPAPGGAADAPAGPVEPATAASEDAPPSEPAGEGDAAPDEATVRILSGTKRYHRADCSLIEDIGDEAEDLETISRAEARTRGCTPCLVCRPDDA